LGAINAITREIVTVTNDDYINSQTVIALFTKLAAKFSDLPITVVLDNARYQQCNAVTTAAQSLKIDLLFLPPYSPNLNLIERLWKHVKKKCLNSKYHISFAGFKTRIMECLSDTEKSHREELASLLTLKFQLFNNQSCVIIQQSASSKKSSKIAA